jgi:hypothetical protein
MFWATGGGAQAVHGVLLFLLGRSVRSMPPAGVEGGWPVGCHDPTGVGDTMHSTHIKLEMAGYERVDPMATVQLAMLLSGLTIAVAVWRCC